MVRVIFVLVSLAVSAGISTLAILHHQNWWYAFIVIGPLILIGLKDMLQKKHAIKKNFPLIGNIRYMLEAISPEIGRASCRERV